MRSLSKWTRAAVLSSSINTIMNCVYLLYMFVYYLKREIYEVFDCEEERRL